MKLIWEYYIDSVYYLNRAKKTKLFKSKNYSLNRKVFEKLLPTPIPPDGNIPPQ